MIFDMNRITLLSISSSIIYLSAQQSIRPNSNVKKRNIRSSNSPKSFSSNQNVTTIVIPFVKDDLWPPSIFKAADKSVKRYSYENTILTCRTQPILKSKPNRSMQHLSHEETVIYKGTNQAYSSKVKRALEVIVLQAIDENTEGMHNAKNSFLKELTFWESKRIQRLVRERGWGPYLHWQDKSDGQYHNYLLTIATKDPVDQDLLLALCLNGADPYGPNLMGGTAMDAAISACNPLLVQIFSLFKNISDFHCNAVVIRNLAAMGKVNFLNFLVEAQVLSKVSLEMLYFPKMKNNTLLLLPPDSISAFELLAHCSGPDLLKEAILAENLHPQLNLSFKTVLNQITNAPLLTQNLLDNFENVKIVLPMQSICI